MPEKWIRLITVEIFRWLRPCDTEVFKTRHQQFSFERVFLKKNYIFMHDSHNFTPSGPSSRMTFRRSTHTKTAWRSKSLFPSQTNKNHTKRLCDDTRAGSKAKNKILEKHYSNFSLWETKLPPKKCACLKENFPSELCRCFGGSCWRVLVKKNTSTKIKSSCMTGTNACKDITPRMGSPQEQICKAPVR